MFGTRVRVSHNNVKSTSSGSPWKFEPVDPHRVFDRRHTSCA
jgi:hypothetical protein